MKLYTCNVVDRLVEDYIKQGGEALQMREGVLGCGDILLYDPSESPRLKTFVIREVAINAWSSGHTIRGYNGFPAKYRAIVDAAEAAAPEAVAC